MKIVNREQLENIIKNNKVGVVDVFAEWCGPCKMLTPILEQLATEHLNELVIVKVDADAEQELCADLNIKSIPTVLFYKEHDLIKQLIGFQPKQKIEDIIQTLI